MKNEKQYYLINSRYNAQIQVCKPAEAFNRHRPQILERPRASNNMCAGDNLGTRGERMNLCWLFEVRVESYTSNVYHPVFCLVFTVKKPGLFRPLDLEQVVPATSAYGKYLRQAGDVHSVAYSALLKEGPHLCCEIEPSFRIVVAFTMP
ncbi:unnamed protein product [Spodoptera exigua]|nr:unnamed protein product [Spodoptera exigua]